MLRDAKLREHFHHEPVPRLRLRQHHAAHRQHEHAAARRREPRHPLPRLARAGPRRRGGEVHPGPGQSAVRRLARLREHAPRTCSRSSRRRRPNCSSWRCSCACSSPADAPPSSCPTACSSAPPTRTRRCAGCWSRTRSSTPSISLPGGVFKPYAGVSTAILLFTKTNSGGTDHVWFYDVDADGWSLDDKRTPLLPRGQARPRAQRRRSPPRSTRRTTCPTCWPAGSSATEPSASARAPRRASACPRPTSPRRATTSASTATRKSSTKKSSTARPSEILAELAALERRSRQGMKELEGMLR